MKLNLNIRTQIVEKATKKLKEDFEKKLKSLKSIGVEKCVLNAIGTPKERERMNKLPDGWMKTECDFSIDKPSQSEKRFLIKGNGAFEWDNTRPLDRVGYITTKKSHRIPAGFSSYRVKPSKEFTESCFSALEAYKKWQEARADIYINLKQFKDVESLKKSWPEGAPFLVGLTYDVSTTALSVRWDKINSLVKGVK